MQPRSYHHVSLAWLVLTLAWTNGAGAGEAESSSQPAWSIDGVVQGVRQRSEAMGGAHMRFTYSAWQLAENGTPRQTQVKYEYEVDRIRGKLRFRRELLHAPDGAARVVETVAWDGSQGTGFGEFFGVDADHRYRGLMSAEQGGPFLVGWWLTALEEHVFDVPTPLAELMTTGEWKVIRTEEVDGYETCVVEGNWPGYGQIAPLNGSTTIVAWLAPAHDFAPLRMTYRFACDGIKEIRGEMKVQGLKRSDHGIWVPEKVILSTTNPNVAATMGAETTVSEFTFSEYQTGLSIPDTHFTVKFPVGTRVFDDITKTSFIAGKAVFVRRDDGNVEMVPMPADHDLQAWTDTTRGISEHEWQEWWASITAPVPVASATDVVVGTRRWVPVVVAVTALVLGVVILAIYSKLREWRQSA